MDPQQELFTKALVAIRERGRELGFKVYDGFLPPRGTAYPFVYLEDTGQDDKQTKGPIIGTVNLKVSVWHDKPTRRGDLSSVMETVKDAVRRLPSGTFRFDCAGIKTRIIAEPPGGTERGAKALLHGVIDAKFRFSPANSRKEDRQ